MAEISYSLVTDIRNKYIEVKGKMEKNRKTLNDNKFLNTTDENVFREFIQISHAVTYDTGYLKGMEDLCRFLGFEISLK